MKQMRKRLISAAMAFLLLASVFAGCGDSSKGSSSASGSAASTPSDAASSDASQSSSKATDTAASGEMVEITAMVFDRGNTPEGEGTVSDNRWTQYLNEEMAKEGVHVTFVPIPRSEEGSKIPVLMASGTAADIMMMYNPSMIRKFYQDGGTYDFAPYMEYAPDLVEYLGEECISYGQDPDGTQWGIPARRSTTAQSNAFIRKDWLDALGLDIPKTVDELYDALKAFKDQDPGNVGTDKIVCFTSNDLLATSFLQQLDDIDYMTNKGNEIYNDPGYAEYYRFKNKLYNDGLMDPEYFTSKNFSQKEKELCVSGQLGYWEYDVGGNVDTLRGGLLQNLKQNIPEAEFVSMPPVANVNDNTVYNPSYPLTGAFLFMPKTAKEPEAVLKYLNLLAGDGGFTVFHGIEGEHFDYDEGVPVVKDAEYNANSKDWTRHDLFLVGNQGYYLTEDDFIAATSKELPGWEQYVIDNYDNAMAGTRLPNIDYTSDTQTEQSANTGKVNDDYKVKVTTCKPEEVDAIVAEWKAELEKYDIQTVFDERRAYFETIFK